MNKSSMSVVQMKKITLLATLVLSATMASASVIYTDYSATPLTHVMGTTPIVAGTEILFTLALPGDDIVCQHFSFGTTPNNYFGVYGPNFKQELVGSYYFARDLTEGQSWGDLTGSVGAWGNVSTLAQSTPWTTYGLRADPTYIPFMFADPTDNNIQKYGYLKTSIVLSGTNASSELTLKVYGYGYETTGTEIAMGVVPEPASALLLILGGISMGLYRRAKRLSQELESEK